jgi:phosphate transport system protein
MLEGHISKAFDGALLALHMRVLEMGGLVLDQVREAAKAYSEWDLQAAERVVEREGRVREYESALHEDQFTLIARRAPVASDLRAIIALSKIAVELERAGNEARKIARVVLQQSGRPGHGTSSDVRHLAILATRLLRTALEALDRLDAPVSADVIARDEELDAEYAAGLRRLLSRAMEDPRHFEVALEAAFVLKSLERIGDNARNLALQVRAIAREIPVGRSPAAPESAAPLRDA